MTFFSVIQYLGWLWVCWLSIIPANLGAPGFGSFYHSSSSLEHEFKNLAARCPHVEVHDESSGSGTSLLSVHLPCRSSSSTAPCDRVLIMANEHARELITAEVALHFASLACDPTLPSFSPDASTSSSTSIFTTDLPPIHPTAGPIFPSPPIVHASHHLLSLLESNEILIFPNVAGDMRILAERGEYCRRTNSQGIDLNSDWDWGYNDTSSSKMFAASETQLLHSIIDSYKPTIYLSLHSGSYALYSPLAYTHTPSQEELTNIQDVLKVIERVRDRICVDCKVGIPANSQGYVSRGTSLDYMYMKYAHFSFALQVWDGELMMSAVNAKQLQIQDNMLNSQLRRNSKKHFVFIDTPTFMEGETALNEKLQPIGSSNSAIFPSPRDAKLQACLAKFNPINEDQVQQVKEKWAQAIIETIYESNKAKLKGA